jgi:pseudouridine synthase
MKRRKSSKHSKTFRHSRTATGARRATEAPKRGAKPTETSISRQKLLDVSRLDRKATLRAAQSTKGKEKTKLPELREEEPRSEAKSADGKERLQKIIATAGICSRRKAEELIIMGQVLVNGEVVNALGAKADPYNDIISVEGKVIEPFAEEKMYFLLNKPRGYITSTSDPQGRPTVMELMKGVTTRIYPVGRLDYASEGLILLTNDGAIANKLMHPSSQVRRTYAVKVRGTLTDDQIKLLRKGVHLSDGFVKPLRVGRGDRLENKEWVEIEITEGKNLEIRRIFAVLDMEVDRLRRIGIGNLEIGKVPVGKYIRLTKRQLEEVLADKKAPLSKKR